MDKDIMAGLEAAFSDDDDLPPEPQADLDDDLDEELPAPQPDDGDEPPEPDAQDDGDEAEEAPAKGADTLTLVGPDGEPVQMKLDKLLNDTLHDVEVDGEKRQIPYKDLLAGYMMQSDYSRKTAEVAQQRDELMPYAQMVAYAKSDPQFVQYMQAYFVNGPDADVNMSKYGNVTDEQLSAMLSSDDPGELARAREIAKERAQVNQRRQQRAQVLQKAQAEQAQLFSYFKDAEARRAKSQIPDYDELLTGRDDYLRSVGFTPQEAQLLVDHRMQMVVADAQRYRRSLEQGTSVSKLEAKRKQPRPPRAVSSGKGKPEATGRKRSQTLERRARESGRTEDWAGVIADRLGIK